MCKFHFGSQRQESYHDGSAGGGSDGDSDGDGDGSHDGIWVLSQFCP